MEFSSGQRGGRESSCGFWKSKEGRQEGEHSVRGRRNTTITAHSRAWPCHLNWVRVGQISEECTRIGLSAQACTLPWHLEAVTRGSSLTAPYLIVFIHRWAHSAYSRRTAPDSNLRKLHGLLLFSGTPSCHLNMCWRWLKWTPSRPKMKLSIWCLSRNLQPMGQLPGFENKILSEHKYSFSYVL